MEFTCIKASSISQLPLKKYQQLCTCRVHINFVIEKVYNCDPLICIKCFLMHMQPVHLFRGEASTPYRSSFDTHELNGVCSIKWAHAGLHVFPRCVQRELYTGETPIHLIDIGTCFLGGTFSKSSTPGGSFQHHHLKGTSIIGVASELHQNYQWTTSLNACNLIREKLTGKGGELVLKRMFVSGSTQSVWTFTRFRTCKVPKCAS